MDGRERVVIERVEPAVDGGRFPVKRVVGDSVTVRADVFADGHDRLSAVLLYRGPRDEAWRETPMRPLDNDRWEGSFAVTELGLHRYTVEAWVDRFTTWQAAFAKRVQAGQELGIDLLVGAGLVQAAVARAEGTAEAAALSAYVDMLRTKDLAATTAALDPALTALMERHPDRRFAARHDPALPVTVERALARFGAWYERFPRSAASAPGRHGTLRDLGRLLPEIARMGFDIVYLPPIHPIGRTHRKGRNNAEEPAPDDPGSPWAIGAAEGGHTAVHPELGTLEDFRRLVASARRLDLEIALDLAFQCSPDHPWVREHPGWFVRRPDGTVQYAENPPKRYQDIYPVNFETDEWEALWQALRDVVLFWVEQDVRIFRVDNPHTKPFPFWEWVIGEVRGQHPDVLFLSEAFTRPKVMYRLAKVGFSQSYTYFTWRTTKPELTRYLTELTRGEVREFFRPNFWPNTPDILPEHLQFGGRPAFAARLVLAATLSSNYGIYGPAFELAVTDALPGKEEYRDSEKYELKHWDWNAPGNLRGLIARVNRVRRDNPALHLTENLVFVDVDNDHLLGYAKASADGANLILVVVNLDPFHTQSGWTRLPLRTLGIAPQEPFALHDLLTDRKLIWQGERNYVELDPQVMPAAVYRVQRRLRHEQDFDYYY